MLFKFMTAFQSGKFFARLQLILHWASSNRVSSWLLLHAIEGCWLILLKRGLSATHNVWAWLWHGLIGCSQGWLLRHHAWLWMWVSHSHLIHAWLLLLCCVHWVVSLLLQRVVVVVLGRIIITTHDRAGHHAAWLTIGLHRLHLHGVRVGHASLNLKGGCCG